MKRHMNKQLYDGADKATSPQGLAALLPIT